MTISERISQRIRDRIEERVYQQDIPAGAIPLTVEVPVPEYWETEW